MQYRKNIRNNEDLSLMGFGCMRFPSKGLGIDEGRSIQMIRDAVKLGINYFDTAYVYYNGNSETILGKALSAGLRKNVNIATKLPHYLVRREKDIERMFATQLKRLQTDYIDYYLIHSLSDISGWKRLVDLGITEWIIEKKKQGIIKNIGFSFHGTSEKFVELIDCYDWDFVQIQYNYLDINNQAGKQGLEYAYKKGLPVIIMEPLRGGKLVNEISSMCKELINKNNFQEAELGLAWVFNHPEVTVVLSGMSDEKQLSDNCKYTDLYQANSLSSEDLELVEKIRSIITKDIKVPCTGCRYCMPCPSSVDIPGCFTAYNEKYIMKGNRGIPDYLKSIGAFTGYAGNAGKCINCGKCKPNCPQSIDIPEELNQVKKEMEGPIFKIAVFALKFLLKRKSNSN